MKALTFESIQTAAERTNPQMPCAVLENRTGIVAEQSLVRRVRRDFAVRKLIESIFRTGPEAALAI